MTTFASTNTTMIPRRKIYESGEHIEVIMAPQSARAIVQFDDVPIKKTAKRLMRIFNPLAFAIEVSVTKAIDPEHNIIINWTKKSIPAHGFVEMQIIWNPQMNVSCKEIMQLTDDRNFCKDIVIILKSKSNDPAKNIRKFPTVSSGVSGSFGYQIKSSIKATGPIVKDMVAQINANLNRAEQSLGSPLSQNICSSDPAGNALPNACEDLCKENIKPLTPAKYLTQINKLHTLKDKLETVSISTSERSLTDISNFVRPSASEAMKSVKFHSSVMDKDKDTVSNNKFKIKHINALKGRSSCGQRLKERRTMSSSVVVNALAMIKEDVQEMQAVASRPTKAIFCKETSKQQHELPATTSRNPPQKSKIKSVFFRLSPSKRHSIQTDVPLQRRMTTNAMERFNNWPPLQKNKFKFPKRLSQLTKPRRTLNGKDEPTTKLYDTALYLQSYCNPDPVAATTTCDPFIAATMYLDECSMDKYQYDFKKWLNALVAIPAELNADCNTNTIDVGNLFKEVHRRDSMLAPTTKAGKLMYYLTKLRQAAQQFYQSVEMSGTCSKVAVYVNKNAIRIPSNRNLHLDVVMQRYILKLLLCFNPLWLRLGLEVVYGENLDLHSNRDIVGLSTFILHRLFRDKCLEEKHPKTYRLSEEYGNHIKKYTLEKMLSLLLFLDKAATSGRIIKPNHACLFVRESPHKKTKEILLKILSELQVNIGGITRELKRLGYTLEHNQTSLEEFDYTFNNLAEDLRDGIRLTRIMDILLMRDDLTPQLRVPATSRGQRIFNVKLAMGALRQPDFELKGNIAAADIAEGHREKTLSLLWQIIYKFRAPKFDAAAKVLQNWWRRLRPRLLRKSLSLKEVEAAKSIQRYWRCHCLTKRLREKFLAQRRSALVLQRRYRAKRAMHLERADYRRLCKAACSVQKRYHANVAMKKQLQDYQQKRKSVIIIQQQWRATRLARCIRYEYVTLHRYTLILQRKFRANKLMLVSLSAYQQLKTTAITIQRRYRAKRLMLKDRTEFKSKLQAVITIQTKFRGYQQMRIMHAIFCETRAAVACLQQHIRDYLLMKRERMRYLQQQRAAIVLQRAYKARLAMLQDRTTYVRLKSAVICMQKRYRAKVQMRRQMEKYSMERELIIAMQRRFRAKLQERLRHTSAYNLRSKKIPCPSAHVNAAS